MGELTNKIVEGVSSGISNGIDAWLMKAGMKIQTFIIDSSFTLCLTVGMIFILAKVAGYENGYRDAALTLLAYTTVRVLLG